MRKILVAALVMFLGVAMTMPLTAEEIPADSFSRFCTNDALAYVILPDLNATIERLGKLSLVGTIKDQG